MLFPIAPIAACPAWLRMLIGAAAAVLAASSAQGQDVQYFERGASARPFPLVNFYQTVYKADNSVTHTGWLIEASDRIIENFEFKQLGSMDLPPSGTPREKADLYFAANPDADGVILVGDTSSSACGEEGCPPLRAKLGCERPTGGLLYGAKTQCVGDTLAFSLNHKLNQRGGMVGFKIKGNVSSYTLRIFVCDSIVTYLSGHAFVELVGDGQVWRLGKNTWGVNPVSTARVLDEVGTVWTQMIEWPLTRDQYNAAVRKARKLKKEIDDGNGFYWALEENCVKFAVDIAEAAGVSVPRYRTFVPPFYPSPSVLAASLKYIYSWQGGCYPSIDVPARLRGKVTNLEGNFGGGQNRYRADPDLLIAQCMESPEQGAATFSSVPTYHTGPSVTVGRNQPLTLDISSAYPNATILVTDFDDGSDAVLVSRAEHAYSSPGAYLVKVMAIDTAGLHAIEVAVNVSKKGGPAVATVVVPQLPPRDQPVNPGIDAEMPQFSRTFPADVNCDWIANGEDLAMVLAAWGSTEPTTADIDDDGVVNANDLAVVLAGWGSTGR